MYGKPVKVKVKVKVKVPYEKSSERHQKNVETNDKEENIDVCKSTRDRYIGRLFH
jgi:hypothetical protein